MQPFWLALQFLTRLPTPHLEEVRSESVGRSLLFYPFVGLIMGGLLLSVTHLASSVPPLLLSALVLTLWVALSGALHIDGVADMADAWVGGLGDRERTLAIMKDPYCGPMGVSAVVMLLLLKFTALDAVLSTAPMLLLVVPVVGRSFVVLLMLLTPYCREQGLASDMVRFLPRPAAWAVLTLVLIVILLMFKWIAVWIVLIGLFIFFIYRQALMRRLNGFTGDAAGALVEMIELCCLLVFAVILG